MTNRTLGRTGIRVSAISFGAGPVAGLMTGDDVSQQHATVARAIEAGINWFDTAPGYGEGRSESNLGRVLAELKVKNIHIATKVRIPPEAIGDCESYVYQSVTKSLKRLGVSVISLIQIHNGITTSRGDEPASISVSDVLGPIINAFRRLQFAGLVRHIGLTGTGYPSELRRVIESREFDAIQLPYNILNPSAGREVTFPAGEINYGNIFATCSAMRMGIFAIRVFAGGAILGHPPSEHTRTTPYFPLTQYERDRERANLHFQLDPTSFSRSQLAMRFSLAHPAVCSGIIGFGSPDHVEELTRVQLDLPVPNDICPSE